MIQRGDIWRADLDPTTGHEQGRTRPCLIMSENSFNNGPANLVIIIPLTTTNRSIPLHVEIHPTEGGISNTSYILCDQLRTISTTRLKECWGQVSDDTMIEVEKRVRQLLGL
ncbi:MAG: type II toxin-antitoxin system PemK/MazF family toxin [bacterium]